MPFVQKYLIKFCKREGILLAGGIEKRTVVVACSLYDFFAARRALSDNTFDASRRRSPSLKCVHCSSLVLYSVWQQYWRTFNVIYMYIILCVASTWSSYVCYAWRQHFPFFTHQTNHRLQYFICVLRRVASPAHPLIIFSSAINH